LYRVEQPQWPRADQTDGATGADLLATRTRLYTKSMPKPTDIKLHSRSRRLEVVFDSGETFFLPCEYLRVNSPSAEVQGHGPGQKVLVTGKQQVGIKAIHAVGHYAVMLEFDDGHNTGIYSWQTLYELGKEQDVRWEQYLNALKEAGTVRPEPNAEASHD